jgi:type 1 glutamine amidotransferase
MHSYLGSFDGWATYDRMIGIGWSQAWPGDNLYVEDETGEVVHMPPFHGPGSGHGKQHSYTVKSRRPDHPIMKGFPVEWLHGMDELYHGMRGPAKNLTVLATSFADASQWGSGYHEPMLWTVEYYIGRTFGTVLGHRWWSDYVYEPSHGIVNVGENGTDAQYCVGFQTIMARGIEWAATGKVTIPLPGAFPSKEKASLIPPEQVDWSGN